MLYFFRTVAIFSYKFLKKKITWLNRYLDSYLNFRSFLGRFLESHIKFGLELTFSGSGLKFRLVYNSVLIT